MKNEGVYFLRREKLNSIKFRHSPEMNVVITGMSCLLNRVCSMLNCISWCSQEKGEQIFFVAKVA